MDENHPALVAARNSWRCVQAHGRRSQKIQESLFRAVTRILLNLFPLLLVDEVDRVIDQLADHAFHVTPVIANFGELGGLDFDERCAGQASQTPGDLGFSHTGRPDHHDVLGRYLALHFLRQLLPPPAIADGDRHRAFCVGLSDDVAIQFRDDFAWGQVAHSSSSTAMLELV